MAFELEFAEAQRRILVARMTVADVLKPIIFSVFSQINFGCKTHHRILRFGLYSNSRPTTISKPGNTSGNDNLSVSFKTIVSSSAE